MRTFFHRSQRIKKSRSNTGNGFLIDEYFSAFPRSEERTPKAARPAGGRD